jgi:serine/threonine protein kinase
MSGFDLQAFSDEVSTLRHLAHPNIVGFVDVIQHQDIKCIIMEYCDGGDLRSLLDETIASG